MLYLLCFVLGQATIIALGILAHNKLTEIEENDHYQDDIDKW